MLLHKVLHASRHTVPKSKYRRGYAYPLKLLLGLVVCTLCIIFKWSVVYNNISAYLSSQHQSLAHHNSTASAPCPCVRASLKGPFPAGWAFDQRCTAALCTFWSGCNYTALRSRARHCLIRWSFLLSILSFRHS